jgi:hypothetical protein
MNGALPGINWLSSFGIIDEEGCYLTLIKSRGKEGNSDRADEKQLRRCFVSLLEKIG